MDLFEYQAKQLFQAHGVPVSLGEVATTAYASSDEDPDPNPTEPMPGRTASIGSRKSSM